MGSELEGDGFRVARANGAAAMFVESARIGECMAYCRARGIDTVVLSPWSGYSLGDTEFLKDYPWVRGIELPEGAGICLSGLRALAGLERLLLAGGGQAVRWSLWPQLSEFRGDWEAVEPEPGVAFAGMRRVMLSGFAPACASLSGLPCMPGLRRLELVKANLANLAGGRSFNHLESLELAYCRSLRSLEGVEVLGRGHLEDLYLHACGGSLDFERLGSVPSLRSLRLFKGAPLPSLEFLELMPWLTSIRMVSVEVENGDLRPLYGRRGVAISWKRRYLQSKIEAEQEIPGITWSPWV